MSDLIRKYDVVKICNEQIWNGADDYYPISANQIAKKVKELPTVDALPVRHGQWIIRDNPGTGWYRVTCSECGEDVTSTAPCIGFFPNAKVVWDYCPYCGARMEEE